MEARFVYRVQPDNEEIVKIRKVRNRKKQLKTKNRMCFAEILGGTVQNVNQ